QKDVISNYGYIDSSGRKSLYCTVNSMAPNSQGFFVEIDINRNLIVLRNILEKDSIAEWSMYVIAGKFMTKLDRLLLIYADSKIENEQEYFWFNEAYFLEYPTPEKFLISFKNNEILLDIRMHLKTDGGVRNHGTGFRIAEKNLINLYEKIKKII
ncbi:MAG: MvaI/BcnI family restriction endonuclease, partial [Ignavibacterium sp.]|nr:MvaI/BcnI family restriction endonuclease [Ignavibacterium sp.]MDW8375261.1 MvaI/BcnI family restriction endonuclease [Ignavibacteriales bacterium]